MKLSAYGFNKDYLDLYTVLKAFIVNNTFIAQQTFQKIDASSTSIALFYRDHRLVERIFEQSMLTFVICV